MKLIERLEYELSLVYKNITRLRTDTEVLCRASDGLIRDANDKLNTHDKFFKHIAQMVALLLENVNMQMEAETSDLLDRRMMQLFGIANKNPKK